MKQTQIRQASLASLPALNRLLTSAVEAHFSYFPASVRRRVIREHSVPKLLRATLDSRRVILVAWSDGKIIGYCLGAAPKAGPAQIYWLFVEPGNRGSNIGLNLLSHMLRLLAAKGARTISIATHDHRRYYERQGFKFLKNTTIDEVKLDILTFKVNS
ncbi:MAG TPA: GNAT family N-acetyltransferase [Candidatus Saccharimonadia bacterium]|nr:GNAT family N-acetyltransferase [Candidatus Saccharimonadia bacterium]